MKTFLACLLAFSVLACDSLRAEAPDADELTTMLNDFLAGASVNDLAAHDRFWAEDLIYTSSSGQRFGKDEIMGRNAPPDDNEGDSEETDEAAMVYSAEDIQIHQYGDTAIVAFRLVGTPADSEPPTYFFNTGTFLRRDGPWKVVAWQATRIPEESAGN